MEQEILVPDLGDYKEVEVIEVLLKVGDHIAKDATMITLETDKATMDLPAPLDFKVVNIKVKVGDRVSKGSLIAIAEVSAEPIQHDPIPSSKSSVIPPSSVSNIATDQQQATKHVVDQAPAINNLSGLEHASPGVRKFARELGVDLSQVVGTNKHGRIGEHDVKQYVHNILTNSQSCQHNNANLTKITNAEVDFSKWGAVETLALSRIKKRSGQQLHKNWLNIPHVTHFETADLTNLENFRKIKQQSLLEQSIKLTPLVFLIKALIKTLQQAPNFNSSLANTADHLIVKKYYNIGIAVDTPDGLVVPVIKQAEQKSITELALELASISEKARKNKLIAEDLQGGTFTISSLGGIGGTNFTPIINAPEVAILGISKHKLTPIYTADGKLEARIMLPFALSYDHRVIDGAEAARFCKFFAEQLATVDSILYA